MDATPKPGQAKDLETINEYLAQVSRGSKPRAIDVDTIDTRLKGVAKQAVRLGELIEDELAQAAELGQGNFDRPLNTPADNPLTKDFDAIRTNLAAPWRIAAGVTAEDFSFDVEEDNDYLRFMKSAVGQLRGQRLELEHQAFTDSLVGLGNRNAYNRDLDAIWEEGREHTIAFIDVDGLKYCNDHFGHLAGNRYILEVAECLRLHTLEGEKLYRIGGDEFVLLALGTGADELAARLEACRTSLGGHYMGDSQVPYSFSYGCAHAKPEAGDNRRQMMNDADRRMYSYKLTNSVRNRIHRPEAVLDRPLNTYEDFHGVQDRIFQAMALTSTGRYLFICNVDTDRSHWSRNAVHDFDLPDENVLHMDRIWGEHIHPDDFDAWREDINEIMLGKKCYHNMRYRARDASGAYVMVSCVGVRLDGVGGEPTLFVGSITNAALAEGTDPATGLDDVRALISAVSERKDALKATDIVAFKVEDLDRINNLYGYETGNDALNQLTGRVRSKLTKSSRLFRGYGLQFALMFDEQPDIELADVADAVQSALAKPVQIQNLDIPLTVHVVFARYPVISTQPLSVLSDLNRRLEAASRSNPKSVPAALRAGSFSREAQTDRVDGLTGLLRGNDFLYAADLHRGMHPDEPRVLVALDLGHMRIFNEWYGRAAGDALIAEVGSSLQGLEATGVGFAGFWGQDDFVAYVPGSKKAIENLYMRVSSIVSSRNDSIGFLPALGVAPVARAERIDITLYDKAKSALDTAKNDFKERIKYFQPEAYALREEEHCLLSAFQRALSQGKITFFVQPQFNIESQKVAGGEVLARWQREDGSFVSPAVFVPLLERNGFVVTLDRHIWSLTFNWVSKRLREGLPCVPVSINVSQIDLLSLDVAAHLDRLAVKYAVPTRLIKVEITESAFADSPETVNKLVEDLHNLGLSVYIDDFGSGSSSLGMLQNIDADVIKLDRRFMRGAGVGAKSNDIVESVVNMAWAIGMPVVIEGTETQEHVDFLKRLGCRYVQGFYYYRPMPVEEFEALLDEPGKIDPRGIYLRESQGGGTNK